jgi:hypothetical protein
VIEDTGDWGPGTGVASNRHLTSLVGYPRTMQVFVLLFFLLLFPGRATAQSLRAVEKSGKTAKPAPVPKQYLPPAGMCRVWVDNVPAARQPAPTDCATAIRNRPPNARVIFPDRRDGRVGQPKTQTPTRPRADTTRRRKPPA